MKITILGASGLCGKELVKQAVQRGHDVVAVVRSSAIGEVPAGATVKDGALDDVGFLQSSMKGADAVMSGLGIRMKSIAPWAKPQWPNFLSQSTPAIVEALKGEKIQKVWAISAAGVGDSRDKVPGVFRAMIRFTALKYAYAELEVMESLYRQSGLNVCLPRPTGLTNASQNASVTVAQRLVGNAQISRADVAKWMLDQWESGVAPSGAPIITSTGAA